MTMEKLYSELESTLVMLLVSSDLSDGQKGRMKPNEKRKQSRQCLFDSLTPFDHGLDEDDCPPGSQEENLDWLCRASLQAFAQGDFTTAKKYASKAHSIDDKDACVLLCCARLYSPSITKEKKNPKENRTKSLRFLGSCLTDNPYRNHPYTLIFAAHIYFIHDRLDDSCIYLKKASEAVAEKHQSQKENHSQPSQTDCQTRVKECIADALCESYLEIYTRIDESENTEILKLLCQILRCESLVESREKALREAEQRANYVVEQAVLNDDYNEVALLIPEIDTTLTMDSELLEAVTNYWKPMRSQTERLSALDSISEWIDTRQTRIKSAELSEKDVIQQMEELILLFEARVDLYREWARLQDAEVDQIAVLRMREKVASLRRRSEARKQSSIVDYDHSEEQPQSQVSYPKLDSRESRKSADKRKLAKPVARHVDDDCFNDPSVIDDDLDTASESEGDSDPAVHGGRQQIEQMRNSERDIRSGLSTDDTRTTVSGDFSLISDQSIVDDKGGAVSKEQTPNVDYSSDMSDGDSIHSGDISPMREQRAASKVGRKVHSEKTETISSLADSVLSEDWSSLRSRSIESQASVTSREMYSEWDKEHLVAEVLNANAIGDRLESTVRELRALLAVSQKAVDERNKIISELNLENGDLRRMVSEQKRRIAAIRDEARTAETTRVILKSAFGRPLSPLDLKLTPQFHSMQQRKVSEMSDQLYGILDEQQQQLHGYCNDMNQNGNHSGSKSAECSSNNDPSGSVKCGRGCYQVSTLVISLFVGCLGFLLLCSLLYSSSSSGSTKNNTDGSGALSEL